MNDRILRYTVRGLVIVVMACAMIATWAARLVLSSGSGTLYGYLIYLPILAVPGWLAWKRPTEARWLALWGAIGWFATIVHLLAGDAYTYERQHEHWDYVQNPTWTAIILVLIGAPLLAFVVAGYARRHTVLGPEDALISQRLRRIAQLALLLGVVAIGFSLIPFEHPHLGTMAAGMSICMVIVLVPAAVVIRAPRRRWAWVWSAWTLPFAGLGSLLMLDMRGLPTTWQLSFGAAGTMFVLLLIVMPFFCLTTRNTTEPLPSARVH